MSEKDDKREWKETTHFVPGWYLSKGRRDDDETTVWIDSQTWLEGVDEKHAAQWALYDEGGFDIKHLAYKYLFKGPYSQSEYEAVVGIKEDPVVAKDGHEPRYGDDWTAKDLNTFIKDNPSVPRGGDPYWFRDIVTKGYPGSTPLDVVTNYHSWHMKSHHKVELPKGGPRFVLAYGDAAIVSDEKWRALYYAQSEEVTPVDDTQRDKFKDCTREKFRAIIDPGPGYNTRHDLLFSYHVALMKWLDEDVSDEKPSVMEKGESIKGKDVDSECDQLRYIFDTDFHSGPNVFDLLQKEDASEVTTEEYLKAELSGAAKNIAGFRAKIDDLEKTNAALDDQVFEVGKENAELKASVSTVFVERLAAETNKLNEEIDRLEAELAGANSLIATMRKDLDLMKEQHGGEHGALAEWLRSDALSGFTLRASHSMPPKGANGSSAINKADRDAIDRLKAELEQEKAKADARRTGSGPCVPQGVIVNQTICSVSCSHCSRKDPDCYKYGKHRAPLIGTIYCRLNECLKETGDE
jgi:hypothetical protein